MRKIQFTINELTPMLNRYKEMNINQRRKLVQYFSWLVKIGISKDQFESARINPFKKYEINYTRFSSREPDYDGLVGSAKSIIDILTPPIGRKKYGFHLIEDDKISNTGVWNCIWVKCLRKDQRIYFEIIEKKN